MHFTKEFEAFALLLMREMPVSRVAELMGETDTRLWRMLFRQVDAAYAEADFSNVCCVAVDEGNLRQLLFGVELKVWVRCLVWLDSWRLLLFGFFRRSILFFCLVAVVSWFERRFSDRAQR